MKIGDQVRSKSQPDITGRVGATSGTDNECIIRFDKSGQLSIGPKGSWVSQDLFEVMEPVQEPMAQAS